MTKHETSAVLGIEIAQVSTNEFAAWLCDHAKKGPVGRPQFVTYLNAACSNISHDDQAYADILRQADLVYADGQSIVWAARLLGGSLPERVNAGDFILNICREFARRGIRIGLIGGRPGVAERAAAAWQAVASDLIVPVCLSGFITDEPHAVRVISETNVDVLLVGMSVPVQEKFAWVNRHELNANVVWCVGALFEYYGEGRARAPLWMRRAGLEWLFRFMLEPGRLWRRYLLGNVRFIFRVVKTKVFR